jgi:hypothetical protein
MAGTSRSPRDQGKLDDAVASLRTAAGTVHAAAVNLAADAAETLLGQHLDTHGGLDCW